jgi:hypothetical protein
VNRHKVFLAVLGGEILLLSLLAASGLWGHRARTRQLLDNRNLARSLKLTDLSLWTEARYTRNPSQADRFSAFQDFPGAIEHFPAGAILAPPRASRP